MKKSYLAAKTALIGAFYALPLIALAQDVSGLTTLVDGLNDIITGLIPVAFGLALLFFFYGVALYILAAGDEDSKARGRRIMIGGIIALFVIASIWGIVAWLQDVFGVDATTSQAVPTITSP